LVLHGPDGGRKEKSPDSQFIFGAKLYPTKKRDKRKLEHRQQEKTGWATGRRDLARRGRKEGKQSVAQRMKRGKERSGGGHRKPLFR